LAWLNALKLRIDEVVVDSWPGIREVIGETPEPTLDQNKSNRKKLTIKEKKEGMLVLTNQRLLFLESFGLDGKKIGESVKVSLIDVSDLWFEKAPIKEVNEDSKDFQTFYFRLKDVGKKKQFKAFKKLVEEYCTKRIKEYEEETSKVARLRVT
jgi:hypothetical protein